MHSVIITESHIQALYAGCHYAECHYAECRGANFQSFEFCAIIVLSRELEIFPFSNVVSEINFRISIKNT